MKRSVDVRRATRHVPHSTKRPACAKCATLRTPPNNAGVLTPLRRTYSVPLFHRRRPQVQDGEWMRRSADGALCRPGVTTRPARDPAAPGYGRHAPAAPPRPRHASEAVHTASASSADGRSDLWQKTVSDHAERPLAACSSITTARHCGTTGGSADAKCGLLKRGGCAITVAGMPMCEGRLNTTSRWRSPCGRREKLYRPPRAFQPIAHAGHKVKNSRVPERRGGWQLTAAGST